MEPATHELEQLYHDLAPALMAYFRRQYARVDSAEDLLQETFVRAFRGIDRLQRAVSPRAYLFGIARHVGVDALRRAHATEPPSLELVAPTEAREDERLEAMRAAIGQLPDLHREALHLKLHHNLTYAEISEVLAVPIGTVRSRLHHAVARLRERLNPQPRKCAPTPSTHEA